MIIETLAYSIIVYVLLGIIQLITIKSWRFINGSIMIISLLAGAALSYIF
jgi:hypothetical protein